MRDNGVDIDLPSREDIEGAAMKYELLKNDGPNLVDALHAVIQQAWTGETLPKS
jgi:hypothetical protein